MDVAAAGNALIFFSLFVGLILVGLLVFSYAAYSFFVTLTNTAAGNDEIIWPGEPIQDWLFKVWYLGWLLALWAVPAGLIVGVLAPPRPLFALYVIAFLWLMFPISLLSALSAQSQLAVLRPTIVGLLLKHFGTTLRFYLSSGLVVLICAGLTYAAVSPALTPPLILVPLAGGVGAAGCLIYARLLGRTALIISQASTGGQRERDQEPSAERRRLETFDPWSISEEEPPRQEKRRPHGLKPRKERADNKKLHPRRPDGAYDPWAAPAKQPVRKTTKPTPGAAPLPEDPYGPAEGTYDVMPEAASPPPDLPPSYSVLEEEDVKPYALSASADVAPRNMPPPALAQVSAREEELAAPRRLPPLPDWPMVTGVYSFPFYQQSAGPCGTLAFGFLGVIGLLRLLVYLFPL